MSLKLVTQPTIEPVTLTEAKTYLLIDESTQTNDDQIERMIVAARQAVENYAGISCMTQTWELRTNSLDPEIYLSRGPIQSVTSIVASLSGTKSTVSTSVYDLDTVHGIVSLKSGQSWPSGDVYFIRYVTGYTTQNLVPKSIYQTVLDLIAFKYENQQEQKIPKTLFDQLIGFKVYTV